MPISGAILGTLIQGQLASSGFTGTSMPQLSMAIGNGVALSVLATAVYNGTSTGLGLGSGVSTGILSGAIIIGPTVGNLIFLQMSSAGLLGDKTLALANGIGNAIAAHMTTAIVQGASTIVGIGVGVGNITGVIGSTVGALILSQMMMLGLIGESNIKLANAIGNGVAAAFSTAIVNTTIVGVAIGPTPPLFIPIPSAGTDVGKLI